MKTPEVEDVKVEGTAEGPVRKALINSKNLMITQTDKVAGPVGPIPKRAQVYKL